MDQNGGKSAKSLASAAELRGKKAGNSEKKSGGKKMWVSLISLLLVLGIAVGVYFLAGIVKPQEEEIDAPAETLPPSQTVKIVSRDRAEVQKVTVQPADGVAYTVVQHADAETGSYTYSMEGLPDFNLNQSESSKLVGYAANLTALRQIEENVTDFAAYGLDEPQATITMHYTDGSKAVWLMGDNAPTSTAHYMCRQDTRTVFLVYKTACDVFGKHINDMYVLKMPVLFDDTTIVEKLLIEQKGKPTIELVQLDSMDSTFSMSSIKLVQPIEYDAQSERAALFMDESTYVHIAGYAGEKSNLSEAGLDDPRARIRITDTKGNVLNYIVGNYANETQVYVQVDDTDTVYLADTARLKFLDNANVGYLVDQFTNLVNIEMIDAVTVSAGEQSDTISIKRNEGTATYFFDGVETSEKEFKDVYMEIIGLMINKLSDDYYLEGDVVAKITYTLNVEPYEFTVEYLTYDKDYYAVRRNGVTLFLIKQDRVQSMIDRVAQECSIAD